MLCNHAYIYSHQWLQHNEIDSPMWLEHILFIYIYKMHYISVSLLV